ncbi:hypothetical protein KAU32_08590 [bacterium]|nr:hypothetical protein [bacterium]
MAKKFYDKIIARMSCTKENIQKLLWTHLCGKNRDMPEQDILDSHMAVVTSYFKKNKITLQHINETLTCLTLPRMYAPLFNFLFQDKQEISYAEFKEGIILFKGVAILKYANIKFAYSTLNNLNSQDEIRDTVKEYYMEQNEIIQRERYLKSRHESMFKLSIIPKKHTQYLGYLTAGIINDDARNAEAYLAPQTDVNPSKKELAELEEICDNAKKKLNPLITKIKKIGNRNTDIYLTWEHLNVYVATSMRKEWEYRDTHQFIHSVFQDKSSPLKSFDLRYFDPTQSYCVNVRDKGLLEGLMLKRADIILYMAQETDTFGKDSELSTALVLGKPAIVYIPEISDIARNAKRIAAQPMEYVDQLFLLFQGHKTFNEESFEKLYRRELSKWDRGKKHCKLRNPDEAIRRYWNFRAKYRKTNPLQTWLAHEQRTISKKKEYLGYCIMLSCAQKKFYDNRAAVLLEFHPLSMQIDIRSGVANGVFVVRKASECAELIKRTLLNDNKYNIVFDETSKNLLLQEKITKSEVRVVTSYRKLTCSFWNHYSK